MSKRNPLGVLIAAFLWIFIFAALAVAAKFWILPMFKKELVEDTGSDSRYAEQITVAMDSFSGYCFLRAPEMQEAMAELGVRWVIEDDGADYDGRMHALAKGNVDMAVFTIDSFVAAGARLGEYPGTIVMVIDETKGADAIVAYEGAVGSVQDLNHADAKMVLTPQSPSEFLARTVIAHFNLPDLPKRWIVEADGAEDVYRRFKSANRADRTAYVLWEPYVSKSLEIRGAHLVLDSSKLSGYIVDVLVAERRFLKDRPELVRAVVENYFRAAYPYRRNSGAMENLIMDDAKRAGTEVLSKDQASHLVKGIEWKNTLENYAYFGLSDGAGEQRLEDMISNISDVLVKTGALKADPLSGNAHTIFFDGTLKTMRDGDFHPSKKVNVSEGLGLGTDDLDASKKAVPLKSLTDSQWDKLVPVGEMRVEPISFARGTSRMNVQSQRDLDGLAKTLDAWPQYYVVVVGHTRAQGDPEANRKLAQERADSAAQYLMSKGIAKSRIHARASASSGKGGSSQSVSFELGQAPY